MERPRKKGINDVHDFSEANDADLKNILGNVDVKKMKKECAKLLKKR